MNAVIGAQLQRINAGPLKVAVVFVCAGFPNVTVPGPEYDRHRIAGGVFEKLTAPGSCAGCPDPRTGPDRLSPPAHLVSAGLRSLPSSE